jgi:hypothetical protein
MQSAAPHTSRWPWILLPGRMELFLLFQSLFAAAFFLTGSAAGWEQSAAWWPFAVTFTNLVCLVLLVQLFRAEGRCYWDLFRFERAYLKKDLLALLGILVLAGPVSMLPNTLLGKALFGDAQAPARMLFAALPAWGIYASMVLFPLTQGLTELPIYFLYIMPRLSVQTARPWLAYGLASLFLGLQHIMVPLLFNWHFITWRGLMYLPFAFLMGAVLKWRPRLLPYLAIMHVLIDFAATVLYLMPL